MKKITIFCLLTPLVVYAASLLIGCFILWITDTPNGAYRIWEDNLSEEEILPIQYSDLVLLYIPLSVSLFTCCLNINRKVRQHGFISFVTFFWFIILLFLIPFLAVLFLWMIELYFILYIGVLLVYFVCFRIGINNGYFSEKQIYADVI